MSEINLTLDARGLNCPLPILKTRKAIQGMNVGEILQVTSTDPGSVRDIAAFCSQTGNNLLSSIEEDSSFVFHISKA